eukprot:COSAG03_NODE_16797_length_392_cov_0.849829_1_plen_36_part_10
MHKVAELLSLSSAPSRALPSLVVFWLRPCLLAMRFP